MLVSKPPVWRFKFRQAGGLACTGARKMGGAGCGRGGIGGRGGGRRAASAPWAVKGPETAVERREGRLQGAF